MPMNQTYRLRRSTIAVQNGDGKPQAVVIPTGAILKRVGEDNGFVRCVWDRKEVQLLSFDFIERGELVGSGTRALAKSITG